MMENTQTNTPDTSSIVGTPQPRRRIRDTKPERKRHMESLSVRPTHMTAFTARSTFRLSSLSARLKKVIGTSSHENTRPYFAYPFPPYLRPSSSHCHSIIGGDPAPIAKAAMMYPSSCLARRGSVCTDSVVAGAP